MKPRQKNQFRIIAGAWRRRHCRFADRPDLRPTPDRVRETLFNWLGERVVGARCLDLFAGSGALGFEALSRGASRAVFVERDREVLNGIRENVARLAADGAEVIAADAREFLARPPEPFDLIFVDPPFASGWLDVILPELTNQLRPDARVYLEFADKDGPPALPPGWRLLKTSRAGQVGFALAAIDR